jgi:hypothetical protein
LKSRGVSDLFNSTLLRHFAEYIASEGAVNLVVLDEGVNGDDLRGMIG